MPKRNLYLENTPVEQALEQYQAVLPTALVKEEQVAVEGALGRVTAQPVFARFNSPLFDSAAMDGIGVVAVRTAGARENRPVKLRHGKDFIPVDTGDPIHPPYDAVIMAEDVEDVEEAEEAEEGTVLVRAAVAPWQHVRPVGEDVVQCEMILPGGHTLRPIDIGVLLSAGLTYVAVRRRPSVAVFPIGTEMVEPGEEPQGGEIVESNSRMLAALVQEDGGIPHRFAALPDDCERIKQAVQKAVEQHDMVLVNAGSSAGREDYTVHVLRELGQVIVHGVAMKPGKPVILALVQGKPVIGIPGYPVSAWLAYQNFAAPVLRALSGLPGRRYPTFHAILSRRVVSTLKYREYLRVKVGKVDGRLVASPLARGAGAAMSLVRADGFCVIDQNLEGVEAGSQVEVLLLRPLEELEGTLVSIGSHDLILDLLADLLPTRFPGIRLSSAHVGSMGGLMALRRGEAHMAPIHLLDEASGSYNIPALRQLLGDVPMALIKGVGRTQGIMVKKGNPMGIYAFADLPKGRYVNRQRGAGTRLLLDHLLAAEGIDPQTINGYEREAATHMAVAAAVASVSADAGLGILSAARAMGLDFIPVGVEEYDFALPAKHLELPQVQAFLRVLTDEGFRKQLEALGGYTFERCGQVVLLDDLPAPVHGG